MTSGIHLVCSCCGSDAIDTPRQPAWARITAFLDPRWPTHSEGNTLRDSPPAVGERCLLVVEHPFFAEPDHAFWVYFEPALMAWDGWEDHVSLFEHCGVVQAVLRADLGERSWPGRPHPCRLIEVEVLQWRPILSFVEEPQGPWEPPCWLDARSKDYLRVVDDPPWHVIEFNMQGDVGAWLLLKNEGSGFRVLVEGDWAGLHVRSAYFGNCILDDKQAKELFALAIAP